MSRTIHVRYSQQASVRRRATTSSRKAFRAEKDGSQRRRRRKHTRRSQDCGHAASGGHDYRPLRSDIYPPDQREALILILAAIYLRSHFYEVHDFRIWSHIRQTDINIHVSQEEVRELLNDNPRIFHKTENGKWTLQLGLFLPTSVLKTEGVFDSDIYPIHKRHLVMIVLIALFLHNHIFPVDAFRIWSHLCQTDVNIRPTQGEVKALLKNNDHIFSTSQEEKWQLNTDTFIPTSVAKEILHSRQRR